MIGSLVGDVSLSSPSGSSLALLLHSLPTYPFPFVPVSPCSSFFLLSFFFFFVPCSISLVSVFPLSLFFSVSRALSFELVLAERCRTIEYPHEYVLPHPELICGVQAASANKHGVFHGIIVAYPCRAGRRRQIPFVSIRGRVAGRFAALTHYDRRSKMLFAHPFPSNGITHTWSAQCVLGNVLGYRKDILISDTQPAKKAVDKQVVVC